MFIDSKIKIELREPYITDFYVTLGKLGVRSKDLKNFFDDSHLVVEKFEGRSDRRFLKVFHPAAFFVVPLVKSETGVFRVADDEQLIPEKFVRKYNTGLGALEELLKAVDSDPRVGMHVKLVKHFSEEELFQLSRQELLFSNCFENGGLWHSLKQSILRNHYFDELADVAKALEKSRIGDKIRKKMYVYLEAGGRHVKTKEKNRVPITSDQIILKA